MLSAMDILLRSIRETRYPCDSLSDEEQEELVDLIQRHKLSTYFASYLEGEFSTSSLRRKLEQQLAQRAVSKKICRNLVVDCDNSGISMLVIKGLAIEKCIYGDKIARDIGDIDILVSPCDALKMHEVLMQKGYKQRLGPSSAGSEPNRALVAICASSQYTCRNVPIRRHPYKKEYAPYIKEGCPSIEVHDGFYSISENCIESFRSLARDEKFGYLIDPYMSFALLIANTYENSESFYSNSFDYGVVLRDYVDLHHFFLSYNKNCFSWTKALETINVFNMLEKLAIVIGNYRLIYGDKAQDDGLRQISSLPSIWQWDIIERLRNKDLSVKNTYNCFRRRMHSISKEKRMPLSPPGFSTFSPECINLSQDMLTFQICRNKDCLYLIWNVRSKDLKDDKMLQACFYPLGSNSSFLSLKVDLSVYNGEIRAYSHTTNRFFCAATIKKKTRSVLPIEIIKNGEFVLAIIQMNYPLFLNLFKGRGQIALSVEKYAMHQDNLFWSLIVNRKPLYEDVSVSIETGLICDEGEVISITSKFCCFTVYSDDIAFISKLKSLFPSAVNGWSISGKQKAMHDYCVNKSAFDMFTLSIDGLEKRHLTRPAMSQLVMQDITDSLCNHINKETFIAHAAAIEFNNEAILFMGSSGSGKTSLAVGCSEFGNLMGDECVFLDTDAGQAWCEDYPFQIKENNKDILKTLDLSCALEVVRETYGKAYYFPLSSVNGEKHQSTPVKIRCIVFPNYDFKRRKTVIRKLSHSDLARNTLESLMGNLSPSEIFKSFIHMISIYKVEIVVVEYSDVSNAANALYHHLIKEE